MLRLFINSLLTFQIVPPNRSPEKGTSQNLNKSNSRRPKIDKNSANIVCKEAFLATLVDLKKNNSRSCGDEK